MQDILGDEGVAALGALVLSVELDDLAQIHGVGAAVDDVVAGKCGAGLVGHGVDDAQQAGREGDASDALGVVHVGARLMVALVGLGQPLDDLADGVQRVGVGEHRTRGGDVCLDGVGQRVHAGVGAQLGGHGVGELGVDDGDIRGDVEVCQRVLDALLVVGDDGECGRPR